MPTTSGFAHAPLIRALLTYTVISAILVSALDVKYYFNILLVPHIFRGRSSGSPYHSPLYSGQYWRFLAWPLVYANSTEVLFAAMTLYHLRVVERIWGTRKMATFLLQITPYTTLLPPLLLLFLRLTISSTLFNHLPSGPTAVIFALLAQFHAAVPYTFRYRVGIFDPAESGNNAGGEATGGGGGGGDVGGNDGGDEGEAGGITLTSKSSYYLLPAQLALSQVPGSLIPAIVGWMVGYAWRSEILPVVGGRGWRVPGWVVGESEMKKRDAEGRAGVEVLRRRRMVEEEERGGSGSGSARGSVRDDVGSSGGRRR